MLSLVDDLLHCSGLEATRSLLHTEADLASGACKGPGELCAELGVAAATGEAVLHSALRALRAANAPPPLPSPVKAPARLWDGLDKGYGAPSGDTPLTTGIGAFAGTLPHTGSSDGGMNAGPVDVDDVDAIGDLVRPGRVWHVCLQAVFPSLLAIGAPPRHTGGTFGCRCTQTAWRRWRARRAAGTIRGSRRRR